MSFDPSEPEPFMSDRGSAHRSRRSFGANCVRDVSWHSCEPVMMSVMFEGSGYDEGNVVERVGEEWDETRGCSPKGRDGGGR